MASAYLSRTPSSASNQKTWTWSGWIKRASITSEQSFFGAYTGGNDYVAIQFDSNDSLNITYKQISATGGSLSSQTRRKITNRLFRDVNAWYHIVVKFDAANTNCDIYVNGSEETNFAVNEEPQNLNYAVNHTSAHYVGGFPHSATGVADTKFNGQLAHVHLADGQTYAPTVFGETDSTTGIWKPILAPSVTYGTNGFFLKFDNSANMGLDSAGSNNLTTSGTIIQNKDTPTNVFAKLNFNDIAGTNDITLANTGTTTMQTGSVGDYGLRSTLAATTGKYYWEAKIATSNTLCILPMETRLVINLSDGSPANDLYGVQRYSDSTSNIYDDGTFVQNTSAMWGGITSSDIISFALDLTNGKLFLAKNGAYKNQSGATGDPVNGTNPTFTISDTTKTYTFYTEMRGNDDNGTLVNFGDGYFGTTAVSSAQNPDDGNGIFEYDPPTGYRAWTTKGINAQEYS